MSAFVRLACLLVVTVVGTFHVCSRAPVQASQSAAIYADSDQDASELTEVANEQCHTCAVVAFPTLIPSAEVDASDTALPDSDLVPFHPRLTSPPPRI